MGVYVLVGLKYYIVCDVKASLVTVHIAAADDVFGFD